MDIVAISPTEVKLFVGQENTGFKAVDLQTATAEEVRVDLEKSGKPIKVIGGMVIPPEYQNEANAPGGNAGDRGIILCYHSIFISS